MTARAPIAVFEPPVVAFSLDLPPSELFPNRSQGHKWEATEKIKVKYGSDCLRRAKSVRVDAERRGVVCPLRPVVTMVLTFVLPDKKRRDPDGLLSAFKTGIDAICHAGLLSDDNIWELRIALEGRLAVKGEQACVEIRLEAGS